MENNNTEVEANFLKKDAAHPPLPLPRPNQID